MFVNCSVFCDVRHVRSSILGQNVMFGKFDVRTFNVRSVRSSVFWCLFQDYWHYVVLVSEMSGVLYIPTYVPTYLQRIDYFDPYCVFNSHIGDSNHRKALVDVSQ